MKKEAILLSEFCEKSRVELDFILHLENEGLIEIETYDNVKYLPVSQLNNLESFVRLYYDLAINIEGIDVIHHLLSRIHLLEKELTHFHRRFGEDSFFNHVIDEF